MHEPLIQLNKDTILSGLQTYLIDLTVIDSIDSTNNFFKSQTQAYTCPCVIIAETQTQGRGRFNRPWHSPFGQNIYLSMLYAFDKSLSELEGITLVVSLAICKAIELFIHQKNTLKLKWPNDVYVDDKKLSGTLIEVHRAYPDHAELTIGIGINVNMLHTKEHSIQKDWISLQEITRTYHNRNGLCSILIQTLLDTLDCFYKKGFSGFLDEWNQRDYLLNQFITLESNGASYSGITQGVNEHGQLRLTRKGLATKTFSSGETTLNSLGFVKE